MKDFIKAINSLFDLFDKLSEADTSPSANYSMSEMFMRRALNGDEKAKETLAANISYNLNANLKIVEMALDEWLNNKRNIKENTNMNKNKIRLTESGLRRIVKESINRVIKEQGNYATTAFDKIYSIIETSMTNAFGRESVDGNDDDVVVVYLPNGDGKEYITIKLSFGYNG